MKSLLMFLFSLTFSSLSYSVNYEAEGNLEKTNDVGCIEISGIKNSYTPADLYSGVSECLKTSKYTEGIYLMFAANAYGKFDSYRVLDKTAHQAIIVLRMNAMGSAPKEKMISFQKKIDELVNKNREAFKVSLCEKIGKIQHPDYYPKYMIQHGMNAFTDKAAPKIDPNFKPELAWEKVLSEYLKCT